MGNSIQILLLSVSLLYVSGVHAGVNRKDVLELVHSINANQDSGTVRVWINDNLSDPAVKVGETLSYTITSDTARYYLMILIDPKGSTSVVFPDLLVNSNPQQYQQFVYPPVNTGVLTQGEPVGTETIFAVALDLPLTPPQLSFNSESDIQSLGNDRQKIISFIETFNSLVKGTSVDIARHQYVVDADVQISSRAFRRELAARVQQVNVLDDKKSQKSTAINTDKVTEPAIESEPLAVSDITFETNSDTLTGTGKTQLDVFGSELVNLWQSGDLPHIALEGHTDDRGDTAYNQVLSERRAEAAKRYLVDEYGLPSQSIATRGMGETKPIASNATQALRLENRRVEIRVVR